MSDERRNRDERGRTPARGVPALELEPEASGSISVELRLGALEARASSLKKWIATAVIAGLGSAGAVFVWALNAREAAGDEKARLRYLERAVERLESIVLRRHEQPDAPKGTAP